jgi:hypothetical protein
MLHLKSADPQDNSTAALSRYRTAVTRACEAALDDRVFYQDAFEAYVRERTDHLDPAHEHFLGDHPRPSGLSAQRAFEETLAAQPRGTWALTHLTLSDPPRTFWRALISSGPDGLQPSYDSYDAPPSYADVYGRMVGYEIYLARKAVEASRAVAADQRAIREHQIYAGATYRDLTFGHTTYSTAVVEAIHLDTGIVRLQLTRRGTRKRWNADVRATSLARATDASTPRSRTPANQQPFGLFSTP